MTSKRKVAFGILPLNDNSGNHYDIEIEQGEDKLGGTHATIAIIPSYDDGIVIDIDEWETLKHSIDAGLKAFNNLPAEEVEPRKQSSTHRGGRVMANLPSFTVGDIVRTRKGAHFWGRVVSIYEIYPDDWRADVLAITAGFAGTLHVYPTGQLQLRPEDSYTTQIPLTPLQRMR